MTLEAVDRSRVDILRGQAVPAVDQSLRKEAKTAATRTTFFTNVHECPLVTEWPLQEEEEEEILFSKNHRIFPDFLKGHNLECGHGPT